MRYSKEWINVLKKKISNLKKINEDKNIKIVIFEEKRVLVLTINIFLD